MKPFLFPALLLALLVTTPTTAHEISVQPNPDEPRSYEQPDSSMGWIHGDSMSSNYYSEGKPRHHHLHQRFEQAIQWIRGDTVPQNYHKAGVVLKSILQDDPDYLPARYHYVMLLIQNRIEDTALNNGELPFEDTGDEIEDLARQGLDVARIYVAYDALYQDFPEVIPGSDEGILAWHYTSVALLRDRMGILPDWPDATPQNDLYGNTLVQARELRQYSRRYMYAEDYRVAQEKVTEDWEELRRRQASQ